MIERKNEFVYEMIDRLRIRRPFRLSYRASLILENMELISSIGNQGEETTPLNLKVSLGFCEWKKSEMNDDMASSMFAEMSEKYNSLLSVFTDASKKDEQVGVGIWVPECNIEREFGLNGDICIMNAEIIGMYEGIKVGMNEADRIGASGIVMFSDSKAGLQMIESGGGTRGNAYVCMIYEWVRSHNDNLNIILQWIPSHKSIPGNERADQIAERGRMREDLMVYDVRDGRDVLCMCQKNVWKKWDEEYELKCQVTGKKYRELVSHPLRQPFFKTLKCDTRMIRTIERVRMNHGNWKECLYKRKLTADKMCDRCMVEESIEHLLLVCPVYQQSRQAFDILQNTRDLTQVMRKGPAAYKGIYEFIRITGIVV